MNTSGGKKVGPDRDLPRELYDGIMRGQCACASHPSVEALRSLSVIQLVKCKWFTLIAPLHIATRRLAGPAGPYPHPCGPFSLRPLAA